MFKLEQWRERTKESKYKQYKEITSETWDGRVYALNLPYIIFW